MVKGTLRIARLAGKRPDYIEVQLFSEKFECLVVVEMTPEQFALALTGRADQTCKYEVTLPEEK